MWGHLIRMVRLVFFAFCSFLIIDAAPAKAVTYQVSFYFDVNKTFDNPNDGGPSAPGYGLLHFDSIEDGSKQVRSIFLTYVDPSFGGGLGQYQIETSLNYFLFTDSRIVVGYLAATRDENGKEFRLGFFPVTGRHAIQFSGFFPDSGNGFSTFAVPVSYSEAVAAVPVPSSLSLLFSTLSAVAAFVFLRSRSRPGLQCA